MISHRTAPRTRPTPADQGGRQLLLYAVASIVVGLSLFFPRPQNFAPISALGLFAGAHARSRLAWLLPLAALAVHTVVTGGYHWLVLVSVYLGFAVSGIAGRVLLRHRVRPRRVVAGAVFTSLWFFAISNLGSWMVFGIPRGESLAYHYLLGVPLYWNTLAGDLFFSGALFGAYAMMARYVPRRAPSALVS